MTAPSPLSSLSRSSSPYSRGNDSGYDSGSGSEGEVPETYFTKPHLQFINRKLQNLEPQEILRWCLTTLPHLFQTTAFGLTGLAQLDMLSKLQTTSAESIDLIFLDTLYHFPETLDLLQQIQERYPSVDLHVFKPEGAATVEEFEAKYGQKLWESDAERYDFLVKVEPGQRAYRKLGVQAVLTGRRRTQGGKRGDLPIIEVDEAGLLKVNPMANWTFKQIKDYMAKNNVPYNSLLDRGYKSVGDWHSTQPVAEGEDERAGRWKGQEKTECGLHNPRSRYVQLMMEAQRKEQEELAQSLQSISIQA